MADKNISFENASDTVDVDCFYPSTSNLQGRFYLVLVFGSLLCIVSFFENLFLAYLLTTRQAFRQSPLFYLAVLAVFDVFLSPSWILVQAVPILHDYIQSPRMYYAWIHYSPALYTVSVAVLTASAYLIIFASFETYLQILGKGRKLSKLIAAHRSWAAIGAWTLGLVLQSSHFWEIQVIRKPNCSGFEAYEIRQAALFENQFLNTLFTFYIRNIFDVFIPFFVLLYINSANMLMIRRSHRSPSYRKDSVLSADRHPNNVKDATRELISDVLEYLISNILNVILAFWETFAFEDLITNRMDFYDYSSDTVNILTVFCRTVRLPVYCFCNREIKSETVSFLKRFCSCFCCENQCSRKKPAENSEFCTATDTLLNTDFYMDGSGRRSSSVGLVDLPQICLQPNGVINPGSSFSTCSGCPNDGIEVELKESAV